MRPNETHLDAKSTKMKTFKPKNPIELNPASGNRMTFLRHPLSKNHCTSNIQLCQQQRNHWPRTRRNENPKPKTNRNALERNTNKDNRATRMYDSKKITRPKTKQLNQTGIGGVNRLLGLKEPKAGGMGGGVRLA